MLQNQREKKNCIGLKLITFSKSLCVTPPSMYRMSAKSICLVIDMKSMCKHIPNVGDKH